MNNQPRRDLETFIVDAVVRSIAVERAYGMRPDHPLEAREIENMLPIDLETAKNAAIVRRVLERQGQTRVAIEIFNFASVPVTQEAASTAVPDTQLKSNETQALTRAEIFEKVRSIILDYLIGIDDEEVTDVARIESDLGFDSMGYLDITFRLEFEFNLPFSVDDLFPQGHLREIKAMLRNSDFVSNGAMTDRGIDELLRRCPYFTDAQIQRMRQEPKLQKIKDIFTVSDVVDFIEKRLRAKATKDPL